MKKTTRRVPIKDFGSSDTVLSPLDPGDLTLISGEDKLPKFREIKPEAKEKYDFSLDGFSALNLPIPKTKEEEEAIVNAFLSGIEKLFQKENNWTFLMPTTLSNEYCMQCNTCNEACPIYTESGRKDIAEFNLEVQQMRKQLQG